MPWVNETYLIIRLWTHKHFSRQSPILWTSYERKQELPQLFSPRKQKLETFALQRTGNRFSSIGFLNPLTITWKQLMASSFHKASNLAFSRMDHLQDLVPNFVLRWYSTLSIAIAVMHEKWNNALRYWWAFTVRWACFTCPCNRYH